MIPEGMEKKTLKEKPPILKSRGGDGKRKSLDLE